MKCILLIVLSVPLFFQASRCLASHNSFGEKVLTIVRANQSQLKNLDDHDFGVNVLDMLRCSDIFLQVPLEGRLEFRDVEEKCADLPSESRKTLDKIIALIEENDSALRKSTAKQCFALLRSDPSLFNKMLGNEVLSLLREYEIPQFINAHTFDLLDACEIFTPISIEVKLLNLLEKSKKHQLYPLEAVCLFLLTSHIRFDRKLEELSLLLGKVGCRINQQGFQGRTLLMHLISLHRRWIDCRKSTFEKEINDQLGKITAIVIGHLKKNRINLELTDRQGQTIMHIAAANRNLDACQELAHFVDEMPGQDKNGDTPLHLAICAGEPSYGIGPATSRLGISPVNDSEMTAVCNTLLADKNQVNKKGNTPLHRAILINAEDIVLILVDNKVDVDATNGLGQTPLHLACIAGVSPDILIASFARISLRDNFGNLPLHYACVSGVYVETLFKGEPHKGAHGRHETNSSGWTPLHLACFAGNIDMVKKLIKLCPDCINKQIPASGKTPFMIACENGFEDVCNLLLAQKELNENLQDKLVGTALDWACEFEQLSICSILLADRYKNQPHAKKVLLLHKILNSKNTVLRDMFFQTWKNQWKVPDFEGNTAVHAAAKLGLTNVISVFLRVYSPNDLGLTIRNNNSQSVFTIATREKHFIEVLTVFLQYPIHLEVLDIIYCHDNLGEEKTFEVLEMLSPANIYIMHEQLSKKEEYENAYGGRLSRTECRLKLKLDFLRSQIEQAFINTKSWWEQGIYALGKMLYFLVMSNRHRTPINE